MEVATKPKTVTDPKVDAAALDKLITARIALLLKAPFFGNLATRMKMVNADEWCSTAATDGRSFFYNSEFVNKMPLRQVEFLFGHEVLHAVYEHIGRLNGRNPQPWNTAADYCINSALRDQRIGKKITVVGMLYDPKYRGMSAEEVYEDLEKNADKLDISKLAQQVLDEHLRQQGEGDESNEGQPQPSKEELGSIRDELSQAIIEAVQTTSTENIPGNVKRLLKDLTEPQMNWRELISQQIQSTIRSDYSWTRPSRRGWHMDAILPGTKTAEAIDVCISLDSSGSISREMLRDFLAEVRGIMTTFPDFKIGIWCIDDIVYNYQVFTPDNIDEFESYEIMGGGGNTFEENWAFMRKNDIEPKLFIMFTDGYPCPNWCGPGDENYTDTLFLLHSTTSIVAPFGVTAYYDHKR